MTIRPAAIPQPETLASRVDEDFFWSLVDAIGWGEQRMTAEAAKVMILKALSLTELGELRAIFMKKKSLVDRRIGDYQKRTHDVMFDFGGDSFDDFVSQVVGLGKTTFTSFLTDDKTVKKVFARGWHESFAYCIPSPAAIQMLSSDYYTNLARTYLASIEEQMTTVPKTEVEALRLLAIVADAMEMVCDRKFMEAAASRDQLVTASDALAGMELPVLCDHGPRNILKDLIDYYLA